MKLEDLTLDVLRVLALPNADKAAYFGQWEEDRTYVLPDSSRGEGIEQPAECFAVLAAQTFHKYRAAFPNDSEWGCIRDVWCVLEMALAVRQTVDYYWNLNAEKNVTGPFDDIWCVLEALSTRALSARGLLVQEPKATFTELLNYWDVKEIRGF